MARRTAANFEEGTAGATVDWSAADRLGLGLLPISGSLPITYTNESHTGSVAAHIPSASGVNLVTASGSRVRGGGGWFKVKAVSDPPPDPSESEVFAGVNLSSGSTSFGVFLRRIVPNQVGIYNEFDDTLIASMPLPLNQWRYVSLDDKGRWQYGGDGGPLASGDVSPGFAPDNPVTYQWAANARQDGGVTLIDDLWVLGFGPAVRLYPRDDGRGMSSAPRIWPPSKNRRIIGGYP